MLILTNPKSLLLHTFSSGIYFKTLNPQNNQMLNWFYNLKSFYSKDARKSVLEEHPGINNSTVTAHISLKWMVYYKS